MAKYSMRLNIKRMQDVVVSAKNEKEAIEKAYEILNTGLGGPESTQVEWIDTGPSIRKFGKLPKFDSSRNVMFVFKLAEEMQAQDGTVRVSKLCKLAKGKGVGETICKRILESYRYKWTRKPIRFKLVE